MRRILGFLLLTLAITLPAWPQSTEQQNPIHTQTFDSALPRESFECSATQATLGTHMVNFLDTDGSVNGYVDCHGNIHGASGGSCPGGTDGELQGNNVGACAGVPGSSIDFVNGLLSLTVVGIGPGLIVIGDAVNTPPILAESASGAPIQSNPTDNGDFGLLGIFVTGTETDDEATAIDVDGILSTPTLSGLDGTGDRVFAGHFQANTQAGAGAITESSDILLDFQNVNPPQTVGVITGLHIADQNIGHQGATTVLAGLLIDEQSAGGSPYGVNDANGLFTFQGWNSPETDTLANLTTQATGLPSEGFQKLCSDCDTPLTEGAVCTSAGDMAGALALYIRGALLCF